MAMWKLNDINGASVQYIAAVNDRDGNPQRGWCITYRTRGIVRGRVFIVEGYQGIAALKAVFTNPEYISSASFGYEKVRIAEYREWLQWAKSSFKFAEKCPDWVIDNSPKEDSNV